METKYETLTVTIPSGTSAVSTTKDINFDTAYQQVEGVAMVEIDNGGIPYYQIGIETDDTTFHHVSHKEIFQTSKDVAQKDKFKEISIPISTKKVKVRIATPATTTSDLVFQLVFKLTRNR